MKYSELKKIQRELLKTGRRTKIMSVIGQYGLWELALFDCSYNFPIKLNITKKEGV